MKLHLRYGKGTLEVDVPSENIVSVIKPRFRLPPLDENVAIKTALSQPYGHNRLVDMISKNMKVALLISDVTRPCPSYKILPHIIDEMSGAGVKDDNIRIFFANGMHRKQTTKEMLRLVGPEIFEKIRAVNHDAKDKRNMEYVGKTKHGTEVLINREVFSCDFKIGVANIDIHYLAGYSGGAKSMLPGVSAFETIQQHHSLMLHPKARPGSIEENPFRNDLEEAARIAGLDYIVNVVLDEEKNIVQAVAGDFVVAHRAGVKSVDAMCKVPIRQRADIVIASAGGFPKDINLYQAQKALENAFYAVKEGGTIILLAECAEGFGDETFKKWLTEASCPDDVIARINDGFILGGHKAAAVANVAKQTRIFILSGSRLLEKFSQSLEEKGFMRQMRRIEDALQMSYDIHGNNASIIIMPYAGSTLPSI